jgi:glycosyltransferase involved in cell wall biosynthesis
MTTGVLVDWLGRGGIAQTSQEWVNAARSGGNDVAVITRADRELVGLSPPEAGGRIRTHRALARFAAAQIRERRPAVVVVQNYVIPALERPVYAAATEVGARVVVVVHDHRLHSIAAGNRLGLRRVLRHADTVLAHSRYVADAVGAWTNRDVGRLPHPVISALVDAPPVPPPFADDDALLALHFGVLKRGYKGTATIVDLAARRPPGWRFGLVGVGSPASAVNVEILGGYAPIVVLAAALRQSAAVLLPYRIATQSGAVVAAQALGAVAVASAVGGIPEQIEDGVTGLLLPPDAPVERWGAALDSLRDEAMRHTITAKAQAHVQAEHAAFVAQVQAVIAGA